MGNSETHVLSSTADLKAPSTPSWFSAAVGAMVSRGVVLAAGLGAGIITARELGPEGRGQYFALTTLAGIVAQTANLGMTSSNIFLGAKDARITWPLLVNSGWLTFVVALLSSLAVLVFGDQIASNLAVPERLLWACSALAPAVLFFTLSCSVLLAEEKFTAVNAWQAGNAGLTLALLSGAAIFGSSVDAMITATAVAAVLTVIGLGVFAARGKRRDFRFRGDLFVAGWQFASRAYVVLLLGFLMQRLSVAVLMTYGDTEGLGMYSIASQIFDVLVIVPSSVAMVIFPRLVKESRSTWSSIRVPLLMTVSTMVVICAAVALGAKWVIGIVFGAAFNPAADVVLLLLPAVLFTSITTVLSQFVVSKQFPKLLIGTWGLGVLCMTLSAVALASKHGALGVAVAQSIGSAVVCLGVIAITRRQIASSEAK